MRLARKAEVQAQKRVEKAAKEAAAKEADMRSYKHIMQARDAQRTYAWLCTCIRGLYLCTEV